MDMDAFFASIEQRDNPELRGKPVIIGGDPKGGAGRGVVSTCSYEARKFGVRSALPVSQAYRLCPQGIFVKPDMRKYSEVSKQVYKIFESFTPLVEVISVDEAFLDVTGSQRLFGSAEQIAQQVQQKIWAETGLTCSAGLSAVKFVAKIASDMNKPSGLTIVPVDGEKDFLSPLPVGKLWGVGVKMVASLERAGIFKVGQIAELPIATLESKFGKTGTHIWRLANALDSREIHTEHETKSISQETTFFEDIWDQAKLHKTLLRLSEQVAERARKSEVEGKTVVLKIRFQPFETHTKQASLSFAANDFKSIFDSADRMLKSFYPLKAPVRLIGVGLKNFVEEGGVQLDLFETVTTRKNIDESMDKIRQRFGRDGIVRATVLKKKNQSPDE